MSGSWSADDFPGLNSRNHRITSSRAFHYNCIAWAAGCNTRWWCPNKHGFWPSGVPREVTLPAFLAAFATLGYEESGYEKVALFVKPDASGNLLPTHAAKQLSNGRWTSKLGALEDIEHMKVEDVSGPSYGTEIRFMRRTKAYKTRQAVKSL